MRATVKDYLQLPYTRTVVADRGTRGEALFLASVQELPGCQSHGTTPDEALSNLDDALALYLESLLEDGIEPPMPAQKGAATVV
jgi:predicted RNase H-like HicB family nuclease